MLGGSCFDEGFVAGSHTASGSEHGVNNDEGLALAGGSGHIFRMDADLGMLAVGVHTICRDEAIGGAIEDMEVAFVEGQTGTQDRGHKEVILGQGDVDGTEGRGYGLSLVFQDFRQFECHHFADASDIVSEEQAILLIGLVAQLGHVLVNNGVLLCKVNDFHCSLGLYWVNIRVISELILDDELEGGVAGSIAIEGTAGLALRHHAEFIEVIDALTAGALGPGTREELDVAVDTEVLITVRADCIVAYHLVWETAGN